MTLFEQNIVVDVYKKLLEEGIITQTEYVKLIAMIQNEEDEDYE